MEGHYQDFITSIKQVQRLFLMQQLVTGPHLFAT